jgi:hypothetical protein
MKKLFHILTIRDHYRIMVLPGVQWYEHIHSWRFRDRLFVALVPSETDAAPESTAYQWLVCDCENMDHYGKPAVYFTSQEAAEEWCAEENKLHPLPPKPDEPPPPFPLGTYYMLEGRQYEVRQMVKAGKGGDKDIRGYKWERPYELAWGWYGGQDHPSTWQEKVIAMYDDREEALAHLRRLVLKH